jgi:hypothetical protein
VRDKASEEERTIRVCQIFGGSAQRSQKVPGVVQRHDDHDESAQYIDRYQAGNLRGTF